ncbi:MAG: hypothetical protein KKA79_07100, partial [Nanoarchaeota archaeon]|nr:hypothetical protein [Nanoarchaeota archaeon]
KKYYGNNTLDRLLNKTEYKLNDIVVLYGLIDKVQEDFKGKKLEELKEKISALDKQRTDFINANQDLLNLNSEIESLEKAVQKGSNLIDNIAAYLALKDNVDKFEENNGNFNKTILIGPLKRDSLFSDGVRDIERAESNFKWESHDIKNNLEGHFNELGYQGIDFEDVGNPAKPLMPWGWAIAALLVFPVVRNIAVKAYVKGADAGDVEYFLTGLAGLVSGAAACIFAGFPYVVPLIMASPLVFQPLFKFLDFDLCEELADM